MAANILTVGVQNFVTAGVPVPLTIPPAASGGPAFYLVVHNENSSTDSISLAPAGVQNGDYTITRPPMTGNAIPPQTTVTFGPVFAGDVVDLVPELVGGGVCNVNVTLSPVISYGTSPRSRRRKRTTSLVQSQGQFYSCPNTDCRISPYTEDTYWVGGGPAFLNVYLSPNALAPANYHAFIVAPNGTDTTSGYVVEPQTSITVGPFNKENAPDIFVPASGGDQQVYYSWSPVYDGTKGFQNLDQETNVMTGIANVGGPGSVEAYLPMNDPVGTTVIRNIDGTTDLLPINNPAVQANGVDSWGINLDGFNQSVSASPGTFPFNQGQTSDYSMSFWIKPEAFPGDANYNGIDAVPYLVSNTNVPFGPRWGFVVLISSSISAYGVDGAIVFQPRHGASVFGAGTGFRNTSPEFLANRGEWTHVAINRNIVSGIEIWVNGQLAVSDPFNETSANTSAGDLTIGCRGNDGAATFYNRNTFQGDIDEFALINRVLAPAEITALFEAGRTE